VWSEGITHCLTGTLQSTATKKECGVETAAAEFRYIIAMARDYLNTYYS